ncbi:MAG: thioredoxin [Candidatus Hodarchaeales archaeon]|jgi:thioredoxin 1
MDADRELEVLLRRKAIQMSDAVKAIENVPPGIIELTDATFKATIRDSPIPLFVDLWAPWCMPCKAIAPVIAELEEEYRGQMRFSKLNTDDNQQTAMELRVMSIPTFLIFKDGKLAARFVGAMPKGKFKAQIDKVLKIEKDS